VRAVTSPRPASTTYDRLLHLPLATAMAAAHCRADLNFTTATGTSSCLRCHAESQCRSAWRPHRRITSPPWPCTPFNVAWEPCTTRSLASLATPREDRQALGKDQAERCMAATAKPRSRVTSTLSSSALSVRHRELSGCHPNGGAANSNHPYSHHPDRRHTRSVVPRSTCQGRSALPAATRSTDRTKPRLHHLHMRTAMEPAGRNSSSTARARTVEPSCACSAPGRASVTPRLVAPCMPASVRLMQSTSQSYECEIVTCRRGGSIASHWQVVQSSFVRIGRVVWQLVQLCPCTWTADHRAVCVGRVMGIRGDRNSQPPPWDDTQTIAVTTGHADRTRRAW